MLFNFTEEVTLDANKIKNIPDKTCQRFGKIYRLHLQKEN
jgi:hypothetical protein